ncbi:UvrD-helicase domain-containing protein, partial [Candidatus Dependentiae bacterium]|nr:UvrD-helicase domain-containing protein [Candidatus Dependentiae bacterium]
MNQKNNRDKSIQSSKKKILVSAGAGTGKTTVLVERYLRILISGDVNLEEILAITFTEKAAQEMKERIFLRLLEKERFDLIEKFNNAR